MKHARKLAGILLAMVMALALALPAFAAGTNTITVNDAQANETYNIYKMLDLIVNDDLSAYSYTVNTAWAGFFGEGGDGAAYVSIDGLGYVTWKDGMGDADDMEAFGKAAATYANGKSTAATAITPSADGSITFNNLEDGYYLVTSTNGTLAMVFTSPLKPNATVNEKNPDATLDKQVQEDSNSQWGEENSAQIGDTVNFKTTISAKKGAKNYVLHDQMEDGLTLNQNSIVVKVGETTLTKDANYTVAFNTTDGCDFEITFTQTYLDTISGDTTIVVTYSAILNGNAEIADQTNDNKTQLTYGANSKTEWDTTSTKTFMFDIVKTDSNYKLLSGAKFELYDAKTSGNKIPLVKNTDGTYRVATTAESSAAGFVSAVIEAGKVTVKGLDADTTYWLEETHAPDGYNKLPGRVEVKIVKTNLTTSMTGDTWATGNGGVQITNNAGTELPSTGGIGTTIFYVVGSILVLAAVVLLITKKRMSEDK
ncbi:MAG: SpaH/EbpB family LPXTG-anchored major pilin [Oscillospiraceae bacterium]|nr:SpaH/EbpB family LPXTG-anchored major pilin [Oscillospiraceae bacterium]